MKTKHLLVAFLAVFLNFIFSSLIAQDEVWLIRYYNEAHTASEDLTYEGTGTNDLYWYIKNMLIAQGDNWSTYVYLHVYHEQTTIFEETLWRTDQPQGEKNLDGYVYNVGNLSGYAVEMIWGGDEAVSGYCVGHVLYPSD